MKIKWAIKKIYQHISNLVKKYAQVLLLCYENLKDMIFSTFPNYVNANVSNSTVFKTLCLLLQEH